MFRFHKSFYSFTNCIAFPFYK